MYHAFTYLRCPSESSTVLCVVCRLAVVDPWGPMGTIASHRKKGKMCKSGPWDGTAKAGDPAGRVNDETLFGTIIFSRTNQNQGRSSVNWQVMEDGNTRREMFFRRSAAEDG